MTHFIAIIICSIGLLISSNPAQADDKVENCLQHIKPLIAKRELVIDLGGLWGVYEKNHSLRTLSRDAIQLDSKINKLIYIIQYLCETLDGIPLNELAYYIDSYLKTKDKRQFKEDHLIFGKSAEEISSWLKYYDIAIQNQKRVLDPDSVITTIKKSESFLERYRALALEITEQPKKAHEQQTRDLYRALLQFEREDSNIAQGITEDLQVPRYDIDESVGGS